MNTRALLFGAGALGAAAFVEHARGHAASVLAPNSPTSSGGVLGGLRGLFGAAGVKAPLPPCGGAFEDATEMQRRHDGKAPSCEISSAWHDNTAWDNALHDVDTFGQAAWNAGMSGGLDGVRALSDLVKQKLEQNLVALLVIAGAAVVGFVAFERVTHA